MNPYRSKAIPGAFSLLPSMSVGEGYPDSLTSSILLKMLATLLTQELPQIEKLKEIAEIRINYGRPVLLDWVIVVAIGMVLRIKRLA